MLSTTERGILLTDLCEDTMTREVLITFTQLVDGWREPGMAHHLAGARTMAIVMLTTVERQSPRAAELVDEAARRIRHAAIIVLA